MIMRVQATWITRTVSIVEPMDLVLIASTRSVPTSVIETLHLPHRRTKHRHRSISNPDSDSHAVGCTDTQGQEDWSGRTILGWHFRHGSWSASMRSDSKGMPEQVAPSTRLLS